MYSRQSQGRCQCIEVGHLSIFAIAVYVQLTAYYRDLSIGQQYCGHNLMPAVFVNQLIHTFMRSARSRSLGSEVQKEHDKKIFDDSRGKM